MSRLAACDTSSNPLVSCLACVLWLEGANVLHLFFWVCIMARAIQPCYPNNVSCERPNVRWIFPKSKSNMIVALPFPLHIKEFFVHHIMDVATPDLFREQPSILRLTLMHGFQVSAIPAIYSLLGIYYSVQPLERYNT